MSTELLNPLDEEQEEMSDGLSGVIAARLTTYLNLHAMENKLGWVFGSETDFVIGKTPEGSEIKRRPDVAFCSFATLPTPPRSVVPVKPDLAVEVSSSRDEIDNTDKKLNEYRQAKIRLIWVIRPVQEIVEVYRDGKPAGLLGIDEELDGNPVVSGFKLAVGKLFDFR
jgi:Uma2 family endonuclease